MLNVPFKSFQTLVNDQVKATQSATNDPLDFNVGTPELALVEAQAGMGMWLQWLFSILLSYTRAQTSSGAALDSWMAQFQLSRLPAIPSTGNVTFSRNSVSGAVSIPANTTLLKTTNYLTSFTVIPDPANPNYNPQSNSYQMVIGQATLLAKVQCNTSGEVGNVGANEITFISTPIGGINSVTNLLPFTNGKNSESDQDFRARFILYINSLSRAVKMAYAYVLSNIPEITRYQIVENKLYDGTPQPGYVYTVIDDGTGSPSPDLIQKAYDAIQTVRGLAILNAVFGPTTLPVTIVVDLRIDSFVTETTITNQVTEALTSFVIGLGFGTTLYYSKLFEIIYDVSEHILNVSNMTINGATVDINANINEIFIVGSVSIGYI